MNEYKLSVIEHDRIYYRIKDIFLAHAIPVSQPNFYIISGQPGSYKTALINNLVYEMKRQDHSFVVINADEFRKYHPKHYEIFLKHNREAAIFTDPDVRVWAQKLLKEAMSSKYNIIFEGTMRTDEICDTIKGAIKIGYNISIKIRALSPFESRLNIHKRYEEELIKSKEARFTTSDSHDAAYYGILKTLVRIEKEKLFNTIEIYDKTNKCIYCCSNNDTFDLSVLNKERNRKFTYEQTKTYVLESEVIINKMTKRQDEVKYIKEIILLQKAVKNLRSYESIQKAVSKEKEIGL
jgi:hypothetical protein